MLWNMGNSGMESGAKFTDDTLGLDHLLLFHDDLRTQRTNSKLKVYANISIMTSLPKASLQSQWCLNISHFWKKLHDFFP